MTRSFRSSAICSSTSLISPASSPAGISSLVPVMGWFFPNAFSTLATVFSTAFSCFSSFLQTLESGSECRHLRICAMPCWRSPRA